MTKKDYELIAAQFRAVLRDEWDANAHIAIRVLTDRIADALRYSNPRFNRDRFIAACKGEDSEDSAGRTVRYSQR